MMLIKLGQHDLRSPVSLQGDIYMYVHGGLFGWMAAAIFCWLRLYARVHMCVYMTERWPFLPLTCTTLLAFVNWSLLATLLNGFFIPMKIQHFLREPWTIIVSLKSGFPFFIFLFSLLHPSHMDLGRLLDLQSDCKIHFTIKFCSHVETHGQSFYTCSGREKWIQPSILGFCRDKTKWVLCRDIESDLPSGTDPQS